jgi:hypothetical protein
VLNLELFFMKQAFRYLIAFMVVFSPSVEAQMLEKLKKLKGPKPSEKLELYPTEQVSGEMHKKYMEQIVFSAKPIKRGQENEIDFKNSFLLGENIHIRMYFNNSIANTLLKQRNARTQDEIHVRNMERLYTFKFDNQVFMDTTNGIVENIDYDQIIGNLTFEDDLVGNPTGGNSPGTQGFNNFLRKADKLLTPGTHSLEVNVFAVTTVTSPRNATPMATGKISLIINEKSKPLLLLSTACMCIPGMTDKNIAGMIGKWYNKFKRAEEELKKVVINSEDWSPETHPATGVLVGRTIVATVFSYNSDQKTCYRGNYRLMQRLDESGYVNYLDFTSVIRREKVPCLCSE